MKARAIKALIHRQIGAKSSSRSSDMTVSITLTFNRTKMNKVITSTPKTSKAHLGISRQQLHNNSLKLSIHSHLLTVKMTSSNIHHICQLHKLLKCSNRRLWALIRKRSRCSRPQSHLTSSNKRWFRIGTIRTKLTSLKVTVALNSLETHKEANLAISVSILTLKHETQSSVLHMNGHASLCSIKTTINIYIITFPLFAN